MSPRRSRPRTDRHAFEPVVGQSVGQPSPDVADSRVAEAADHRSNTPPASPNLPATVPPAAPVPTPRTPRLSLTRAASVSRARRSALVRLGHSRALRHGVWADALNAPGVSMEVELTFAAHPALDRIADARMVETHALNVIRRGRCQVAMDGPAGMTAILTSYDRSLAALVERGEQRLYEREQQRIRDLHRRPLIDLQRKYAERSGG